MNETRLGRRYWLCLVVLFGWSAPPIEHARADDTGIEAGVRLGYGIPLGKVTGPSADLSEGIQGMIPIALDLGYRAIPELSVGVYAQYGFGFVGEEISRLCDQSSEIDCSATDIRLGLQAHFHARPGEKLDPWVGLGIGYEWMTLATEGGGAEFVTTTSGFEFFQLQAGLDIQAVEHFYLGPFLSFSFGQYDEVSVDCSLPAGSMVCDSALEGDIPDSALHHWIVLGVRGGYGP